MQIRVVRLPCAHGIGCVDARGVKNRIPELGHGFIGWIGGEHGRGPGGRGGANDGPVDFMARDQLERAAISLRESAIGAANFIGILVRKQAGIGARNREARCAAFEGFGHSVVEPLGGAVEARIGRVMIAQQGGLIV